MIPVTTDDVKAALERELTTDEQTKLAWRVQKASDLVEAYIGIVYADTDIVPTVVTRVTAGVVARLYQRDAGIGSLVPSFMDTKSVAMGGINANIRYQQDVTSGDPWLTKADKLRLKSIYSGFNGAEMQSERGCPIPPVAAD